MILDFCGLNHMQKVSISPQNWPDGGPNLILGWNGWFDLKNFYFSKRFWFEMIAYKSYLVEITLIIRLNQANSNLKPVIWGQLKFKFKKYGTRTSPLYLSSELIHQIEPLIQSDSWFYLEPIPIQLTVKFASSWIVFTIYIYNLKH